MAEARGAEPVDVDGAPSARSSPGTRQSSAACCCEPSTARGLGRLLDAQRCRDVERISRGQRASPAERHRVRSPQRRQVERELDLLRERAPRSRSPRKTTSVAAASAARPRRATARERRRRSPWTSASAAYAACAQPVVRPETASWFSACLMRCSSCQRSASTRPPRPSRARPAPPRAAPRARSSSISFTLDGVVDERERAVELDLEEAGAGRELEHLVRARGGCASSPPSASRRAARGARARRSRRPRRGR